MNTKKLILLIDKIAFFFEMVIAFSLLVVIAIKIVETVFHMTGFEIVILAMPFEKILSAVLTLVIGVEFTKMLCKHTPKTVINVLLFAIARYIVIYLNNTLDLLIGAVAIAGLFAAKKFLVDNSFRKTERQIRDT